MSVIGIDDHEMAEFFDLSTVAQPVHAQGRLAATLLLDALGAATNGERPSTSAAALTVPTRLVVRATTAPPRLATTVPVRAPQPRRVPRTAASRRTS
jgi:DNA-binding LacI/PurR family transcriptional regulator